MYYLGVNLQETKYPHAATAPEIFVRGHQGAKCISEGAKIRNFVKNCWFWPFFRLMGGGEVRVRGSNLGGKCPPCPPLDAATAHMFWKTGSKKQSTNVYLEIFFLITNNFRKMDAFFGITRWDFVLDEDLNLYLIEVCMKIYKEHIGNVKFCPKITIFEKITKNVFFCHFEIS